MLLILPVKLMEVGATGQQDYFGTLPVCFLHLVAENRMHQVTLFAGRGRKAQPKALWKTHSNASLRH